MLYISRYENNTVTLIHSGRVLFIHKSVWQPFYYDAYISLLLITANEFKKGTTSLAALGTSLLQQKQETGEDLSTSVL